MERIVECVLALAQTILAGGSETIVGESSVS